MTTNRAMICRQLGLVPLPLLLAIVGVLGLGGCQTYTYINVETKFDPRSVDTTLAFRVGRCEITVSGADDALFTLPDVVGRERRAVCPPPPGQLVIGTFQYTTFASSGSLTFTMRGQPASGGAELTRGSVTIDIVEGTTIPAVLLVGAVPPP